MSVEPVAFASPVPSVPPATEIAITRARLDRLANGKYDLVCDVSWDDSWRRDDGNWDAAWIFVRVEGGDAWAPVHVSPDGADHQGPAGAVVVPVEDGMGVFVHRDASNVGFGTVSFRDVRLRLDFPGQLPSGKLVLAVSALRMVYVEPGPFWAGDPTPTGDAAPTSAFYDSSASSEAESRAYYVESEDEIQVAESGMPGSKTLYYAKSEFGGDGQGPIPAAFPKGYDAFYVMHAPITQGQFANFLNLVDSYTIDIRYPWGGAGDYRFTIWSTQVNPTIATRPHRSCNWLSWGDGTAFACWAGLRPMSELEYEKACRGPIAPLAGEYAWGNTNLEIVNVLIGDESITEEVACGNCNVDNSNVVLHGGDGGSGPLRADAFWSWSSPVGQRLYMGQRVDFDVDDGTQPSEDDRARIRDWTGSSYYGVLALSGNVWDLTVTVGNAEGRAFTGKHGNGVLIEGSAPVALGWPGVDARGSGYRGGSWYTGTNKAMLADRSDAAGWPNFNYRTMDAGFRCVRTAPADDK